MELFEPVILVLDTRISCRGSLAGQKILASSALLSGLISPHPLVMVGEGRPSTFFCSFQRFFRDEKNKNSSWSAFADHDEEGEIRVLFIPKRVNTNRIKALQPINKIKPDTSATSARMTRGDYGELAA